jgi:hypothetical protein
VERFPPAADLGFAEAVARQLRALDRRVTSDTVRGLVEGRREDDVRRALSATRRARPDDPAAYFTAALGRRVSVETPAPRRVVTPLRRPDPDDPYGP